MYALDVSIILVNYNTEELLVHAIKSVYEHSKGFTFEIIVVDNHSRNSPKDRLNTEFGQQVVYIPMAENVGFGRANNAGIKIARGKYLFLLNTDTYLLNNAIFILISIGISIVTILVTIIFCGKELKEELKRRFHF